MVTGTALRYSYQPLSTPTSTRVLTLLPGPNHSVITIRLAEVDLQRSPEYEAISYTWGSRGNEQMVFVNTQPVKVRQNLYSFLFRLRQQTREPRRLWIDAISISQTDFHEKRQQVSIIGKIFSLARRVLIWLGEHADGSESIFQPELAQPAFGLRSFKKLLPTSEKEMQIRAVRWGELLDRGYWRRMWIAQEIILAKSITVHCGKDSRDWDQLFDRSFGDPSKYNCFNGINWYQYSNQTRTYVSRKVFLHSGTQTLSDIYKRILGLYRARVDRFGQAPAWTPKDQKASKSRPFEGSVSARSSTHEDISLAYTLLRWAEYDFECFDRRDRVYALLSLSADQTSVPPDYQIGIPELLLRVYKQLVDVETLDPPGYLHESSMMEGRGRTVRALMQFLKFTRSDLRYTLQYALNMDQKLDLVSEYEYLCPIAFGVALLLRDTGVIGKIAADWQYYRLRPPPEPQLMAGSAALRHEATSLIKTIDAETTDAIREIRDYHKAMHSQDASME